MGATLWRNFLSPSSNLSQTEIKQLYAELRIMEQQWQDLTVGESLTVSWPRPKRSKVNGPKRYAINKWGKKRRPKMLITLLTDFGDKDPYVGVMKGIIYGLNPVAQVIDLTHQVSPQAVREGAFLLHTAYPYFPSETVHVVVVDPGVGTKRKGICIQVPGLGFFVGPDNGLFSYVLASFPNPAVREIKNPRFMRPTVSPTFHGRDIFAPVAAHLSLDENWEEIGPPLEKLSLVRLPDLWPIWNIMPNGRSLTGEIVHVDHFGTLVTNIPQSLFADLATETIAAATILIAGRYQLQDIIHTYGEAEQGDLVALFGSSEFLEIARVNGRADDLRGNEKHPSAWLGEKVFLKLPR